MTITQVYIIDVGEGRLTTPDDVMRWSVAEVVRAMAEKRLLDVPSAAEYVGLSKEAIFKAVRFRLAHIKIGRHLYFMPHWLDEYKATRKIGRPRIIRKRGRPRKKMVESVEDLGVIRAREER